MLAGEKSLPRAARKVLSMGPQALVVKHGEYGATIFFKEGAFGIGSHPFRAPALPIEEVKDPTGAGDSFAGGFMGYIASQGELNREVLKRALFYGGVMGSFAVEEFGTERAAKSDACRNRCPLPNIPRTDAFGMKHATAPRGDTDTALVFALAGFVSLLAFLFYFRRGDVLLYGDAVAHINIARKVFDSQTPGLLQLGTVWLPLPHLLMLPFLFSTWMWMTGVDGSVPSMVSYVFLVAGVFRLGVERSVAMGR